mgnify:FL=1
MVYISISQNTNMRNTESRILLITENCRTCNIITRFAINMCVLYHFQRKNGSDGPSLGKNNSVLGVIMAVLLCLSILGHVILQHHTCIFIGNKTEGLYFNDTKP